MVVALGPGKFYGSSLPRPRIYTDVKLNHERVDPPLPVLDPLLSWAEEAHWSMGGLSFKRLRLQGRIEGNAQKLKKEKEKVLRKEKKNRRLSPSFEYEEKPSIELRNRVVEKRDLVDVNSPPPAPISKKRRVRSMLDDEGGDESDEYEGVKTNGVVKKRRRLVRKLGDDFELVALENDKSVGMLKGVASRTRSRRSMVLPEEEEDSDDGEMLKKQDKANEEKGSVSPKGSGKNSGKKGSFSPGKMSKNNEERASVSPSNGTSSSPRLKQK